MRTLFLLALGFLSGMIATVLLFTLNDALEGPPSRAPGVGNARIVMDARSLGLMVTASLAEPGAAIPVLAEVEIHSEGTLAIRFAVTPSETGPHGWIVLDPELREGSLDVRVVEADLEGPTPQTVAATIESELNARLSSLAGGQDFTLVSIATARSGLTLEIVV